MVDMRCRALTERNGYYTGIRCHREAKWIVTIDGAEVGQTMCTQHKNIVVKNAWQHPDRVVVEPVVVRP